MEGTIEVRARKVRTDRPEMHVYEARPEDGVPVLLIHGNLAVGRFFEHMLANASAGLRMISPEMRGLGVPTDVMTASTTGA
jgi:hypothetical protein